MVQGSYANFKYVVVATAAFALSGQPFHSSTDTLLAPIEKSYHLQISAEQSLGGNYGIELRKDFSSNLHDKMSTVSQFAHKLINESTDLEPEIVELLQNNFWDLI
jgi:hypothetical protein